MQQKYLQYEKNLSCPLTIPICESGTHGTQVLWVKHTKLTSIECGSTLEPSTPKSNARSLRIGYTGGVFHQEVRTYGTYVLLFCDSTWPRTVRTNKHAQNWGFRNSIDFLTLRTVVHPLGCPQIYVLFFTVRTPLRTHRFFVKVVYDSS